MKQIINGFGIDWPNITLDHDKPIDLCIDSFHGYDANRNSTKILLVKEAEAISNFRKQAIENYTKFDAVLTYDEEILQKCPNARFLAFGTSWIWNYQPTQSKSFAVSNITGHKKATIGHRLRHQVHMSQEDIKIPKDFYISQYGGVPNFCNNKILGDKKEPLFDSQFHICIENSQQKNYFSEKLIDCFVSRTVPIYWGCPNSDKFFDTKGMFIVQTLDDIINVCNSLTPETYNNMLEHVENNFNLGKKYATITDRLEEAIKKVINHETV
jgi:hypothetical protein